MTKKRPGKSKAAADGVKKNRRGPAKSNRRIWRGRSRKNSGESEELAGTFEFAGVRGRRFTRRGRMDKIREFRPGGLVPLLGCHVSRNGVWSPAPWETQSRRGR